MDASPDVVIVPVVTQYDRVMEIKNLLAKVSGAKLTQKSFVSVFRSLCKTPKDHFGEIYVKYFEPLVEKEAESASISYISLQNKNFPITLSSLLATCLRFERAEISMKDLLKRTTLLYNHIRAKGLCTNMRVAPQQTLVERHLNALGFKLKDKGKRACIIMSNRPDLSILEHYSLQIGSALIKEMCQAMSAKFNPQELFEILKNEELDCQSVDPTEIIKNFPEMLSSLC